MADGVLRFTPDNRLRRQTLSFTTSVALHAGFLLAVVLIPEHRPPPPPLEISIFPGPVGPASPPPGEKSDEPGPIGPPPAKVEPAPKKVEKAPAKPKPVARPRPKPEAVAKPPPKPRVEDQGILGALRKNAPSTKARTRAFVGTGSSVALRQRPDEPTADSRSHLGEARGRASASVGSDVVPSERAVGDSLGSSVGTVQLPGPGGGGSGWGGGGAGAGGGGTGRGGFSVTGAGSGGSGRSYASIWQHTQRYLAGLRWAYNNELRRKPSLRGVVTVRYEIFPNGAVGNVQMLSSSLKDAALEREVLRQIRTWRYPPEPTGSVLVTWPFSFLPPS